MRVLMLRNLGTRDWPVPHKAGQTVTVSEEEGQKLIKRGLAMELKTIAQPKQEQQIKAIPPKSQTKVDKAGTKETE